MDSSEDVVLVSVSSKSEKKSSKLKKKMKDTLDKDEVKASIEDVSLEEREDARKSGLSTPRYAVVKNIVGEENLDEATIEVAKSKSTSELLSIAEEADEASAPDALLETELDTAAEADELGVCEEIHEDEPAPVEEDAAEDELDDLNEENDGHDDLTIDDDAEVEVTEKDLNVSSEKVEEVQTKAMSPSAIPLEGSVSEPEKNEITVEEPADKGILGPVESILQEVGF